MGRILGNAVASVDREAGPDTRACLQRLEKTVEDTKSVVDFAQNASRHGYTGALTVQVDDTPTFQTWVFTKGLLTGVSDV